MPLTLYPLACITSRIRDELPAANPALTDAELARHYGLTPPMVREWRQRDSIADHSHRPKTLHCTLRPAQKAIPEKPMRRMGFFVARSRSGLSRTPFICS